MRVHQATNPRDPRFEKKCSQLSYLEVPQNMYDYIPPVTVRVEMRTFQTLTFMSSLPENT